MILAFCDGGRDWPVPIFAAPVAAVAVVVVAVGKFQCNVEKVRRGQICFLFFSAEGDRYRISLNSVFLQKKTSEEIFFAPAPS